LADVEAIAEAVRTPTDLVQFPLFGMVLQQRAGLVATERWLGGLGLPEMFPLALQARFLPQAEKLVPDGELAPERLDAAAARNAEVERILRPFIAGPAGFDTAALLGRRDARVTAEHLAQLAACFRDVCPADADATQRGALLIALAEVFVKLSSSAMFGSEEVSPPALRSFAWALLNSACDAAPDLLPAAAQDDWRNRLAGAAGAFSCTAVLFGMMQRMPIPALKAVWAAVVPQQW